VPDELPYTFRQQVSTLILVPCEYQGWKRLFTGMVYDEVDIKRLNDKDILRHTINRLVTQNQLWELGDRGNLIIDKFNNIMRELGSERRFKTKQTKPHPPPREFPDHYLRGRTVYQCVVNNIGFEDADKYLYVFLDRYAKERGLVGGEVVYEENSDRFFIFSPPKWEEITPLEHQLGFLTMNFGYEFGIDCDCTFTFKCELPEDNLTRDEPRYNKEENNLKDEQ
jgi:hypothetical protein